MLVCVFRTCSAGNKNFLRFQNLRLRQRWGEKNFIVDQTWNIFYLKFISETDIRQVLKNLTKNELTNDEQQKITEKIIEEGDIDNGLFFFSDP